MDTELLERILALVKRAEVLISDHGSNELAADGILVADAISGVQTGRVVEAYPDYHKGPCILVLQADRDRQPVHVLWGIPAGTSGPAVLITAYRPDPSRWHEDFLRRRR